MFLWLQDPGTLIVSPGLILFLLFDLTLTHPFTGCYVWLCPWGKLGLLIFICLLNQHLVLLFSAAIWT